MTEIEKLKEMNQNQRDSILYHQELEDALRQEIAALKGRRSAEILNLQRQLHERDLGIKYYKKALGERDAKIESLKKVETLEGLRGEIAGLHDVIQNRDFEISGLKNILRKRPEKQDAREDLNRQLKAQTEAYSAEIKRQADNFKESIRQLEAGYHRSIKEKHNEAREMAARLNRQVTALDDRLLKQGRILKDRDIEISGLKTQVTQLTAEKVEVEIGGLYSRFTVGQLANELRKELRRGI